MTFVLADWRQQGLPVSSVSIHARSQLILISAALETIRVLVNENKASHLMNFFSTKFGLARIPRALFGVRGRLAHFKRPPVFPIRQICQRNNRCLQTTDGFPTLLSRTAELHRAGG